MALLLVLCRPALAADDSLHLTILHTNDLHGHILPFAYTEAGRSKQEKPSVGGAARRATLIRRLRQSIPNPTILVDSGDTFTRGPLTNAYEGIADIEAMNAVGYELAAIGNNEFKAKDGVEASDAAGAKAALLQVVKRSRFPWLCANVFQSIEVTSGAFGGTANLPQTIMAPLEGVQPYVVRTFNGVRVGFLGLTAPRSATYPQTKGWTITDPIEAAKTVIPEARKHCDVLIALTHIGVDLDKELAAKTTGIDAIVGGDSHTFLYQAVEVKNAEGKTVPIVQDGEFGVNLGRFDLRFSKSQTGAWRLAGYRYGLLPVGPDLAEAPDVKAVIAPYARPFEQTVGTLKGEAIGATPAERERLSTQVVVNALQQQTGADLALNPQMGGFFEVFRRPAVTRYDVFAVMPFKNRAVVATLTGAEIQALVKTQTDAPNIASAGTHISALDPARTYKVALVDFIARSTYKLPDTKLTETGRDIRDIVVAYIAKNQ